MKHVCRRCFLNFSIFMQSLHSEKSHSYTLIVYRTLLLTYLHTYSHTPILTRLHSFLYVDRVSTDLCKAAVLVGPCIHIEPARPIPSDNKVPTVSDIWEWQRLSGSLLQLQWYILSQVLTPPQKKPSELVLQFCSR